MGDIAAVSSLAEPETLMASTKRETTAQTDVPVIEITPVDHGDAHGIGNVEQATIRSDLLHETAAEAEAR